MPSYLITFSDRETVGDKLQVMAEELDITVELLIKRFICEGLIDTYGEGPCIPTNTLDDFLVKNGVLKSVEEN